MTRPRVLLLEDEPVSAEFLRTALRELPLDLVHAVTLAQARRALAEGFDLALLDLNLPDGSGAELLDALGPCPALALSAECDATRGAELRALGFAAAIGKPVSAATLRATVARHLGLTDPGSEAFQHAPIWDEAAALAACGDQGDIVASLRDLMRKDLPDQLARIGSALDRADSAAAIAELHRLRAACGFCGAAALNTAAAALASTLRAGESAGPGWNGLKQAAGAVLQG